MSVPVTERMKGIIKRNDTGEIKRLQFNPTTFAYSRGVSYATVEAPGMAYPLTQFVKGDIREFPLTLFFFDKPYTGVFKEYTWFLGAFLTPETNSLTYTKPPEMTLVLGSFTRVCVLTNLDIDIQEWDRNGDPVHFLLTLTLRQVGA